MLPARKSFRACANLLRACEILAQALQVHVVFLTYSKAFIFYYMQWFFVVFTCALVLFVKRVHAGFGHCLHDGWQGIVFLSLLIRETPPPSREVGVLGDPKLVTFRTKGGPKCQTRFRSDPLWKRHQDWIIWLQTPKTRPQRAHTHTMIHAYMHTNHMHSLVDAYVHTKKNDRMIRKSRHMIHTSFFWF